ncbi:MAG: head GIN domain-containing protein [Pseudonocardiaceae bacterium]
MMPPASHNAVPQRSVWVARAVAIMAAVGLLAGCVGTSTGGPGSAGGFSINGVQGGNGSDGADGAPGGSFSYSGPDGYSYSYSGPDAVTGSGRLTSRTIDLSGVTSVVAGATFDVRLRTGRPAQAKVTMDDNLTDRVEATVTGNELRLGIKPGMNVRNATLSAEVTVGQLNRLAANGASQVMLNSTVTGPALRLDAAGTSAITGPVAVGQMEATALGTATLALSGQVDNLDLSVAGASQLPLSNLAVRHLDVTLSGASHATVTVTDTLSADAAGVSTLQYRGTPRITRQETSGVSSIVPDSP